MTRAPESAMSGEHAERAIATAIAAVYDAAAALGSVAALQADPGGRAHVALMAARSCILLAASIAGVAAPGAGEPAAHAEKAHALIDYAAPAAESDEAARRLERAEEVVMLARQLVANRWDDWQVSEDVKSDVAELHTAVWLYDQERQR